jgi:hypothetical protein
LLLLLVLEAGLDLGDLDDLTRIYDMLRWLYGILLIGYVEDVFTPHVYKLPDVARRR